MRLVDADGHDPGLPPEEGPWPVFVYGTLRPGEELWPLLEPGVVERRPARAPGALHVHASGLWPLLCPDGDSWCTGDLCRVADAGVLGAVTAVELTAGFEARWLPVRSPGGEGLGVAIAFVWPWDGLQRGRRLAGDDWLRRPDGALG